VIDQFTAVQKAMGDVQAVIAQIGDIKRLFSAAMEPLHHGADQSVSALWLGHESIETTQVYIHADLHRCARMVGRRATSKLRLDRRAT
jgi:site-specific recombinase XerC